MTDEQKDQGVEFSERVERRTTRSVLERMAESSDDTWRTLGEQGIEADDRRSGFLARLGQPDRADDNDDNDDTGKEKDDAGTEEE